MGIDERLRFVERVSEAETLLPPLVRRLLVARQSGEPGAQRQKAATRLGVLMHSVQVDDDDTITVSLVPPRPSQRRSRRAFVDDPMMRSQMLRALEQRRLITRAADPDDSRALRLTVTEPGARLALKAIQRVEAADAEFFAPAGETAPVLRLLRLLAG